MSRSDASFRCRRTFRRWPVPPLVPMVTTTLAGLEDKNGRQKSG